jgi:hypothetical protein
MCKLRSATEVMPPATAKIFEETRENPLLRPFILIGGTALALKRMCEGKPDKGDESYSALLPNPPTVEEMQTRFRDLRKTYETSLAKLRLHHKTDSGMGMP